ncbi:MAG: hypothetical protein QOI91_2653 [Solirubrobacteraceae bacterium]|nr:hypothetical protein [Solirubrobacteraceae bacterium]
MLARRRSDLAVAALLTVWAALPLLLLAWAWRHGDVLTGSDGALPGGDQLYYLSLARESGAHVLFGDRFDLGPVDRVGFNPVYLASGLAARVGLDPRAALWLWKPVAALVLAGGFAAYVRGFRLGRAGTAAALALALAYFSPLLPVLDWAGVLDPFQRFLALLVSGELMPAWQLWGYTHAALALGAMAGAAVFAERALSAADRAARRRAVAATAGLGALVALLHPWQGATLALMLAGAAAWEAGDPSPAAAPARERLRSVLAVLVPLAAIAAVLVYLLVLSQTDPHWEADGRQSEAPPFGVGYLLLGFGPLAALAALGVPRHPDGPRERLLLLWPVAAFAVYLAVSNSRFHAFQGMSLPLAILAVRGWRRVRLPRMAGVLAVAAVTLPGLAYEIDTLRRSVALDRNPYYLRPAEARALAHLQDRRVTGGVLAPASIGMAVPARTGRSTWVGHFAWTPDYAARHDQAEALFSGRMPAGAAVALVRATGARFLLSDCGDRPDLTPALRPLRPAVRRFGCATVYELPAPAR